MNGLFEYKGYWGSVEYSDEDEVLHGCLQFIRDLVTYEGHDVLSLKQAFREAVEDYLAFCESEGRKPDQPLKGSFNVRPGRELHRRAMLLAQRQGKTLNAVVSEALERYLEHQEVVH